MYRVSKVEAQRHSGAITSPTKTKVNIPLLRRIHRSSDISVQQVMVLKKAGYMRVQNGDCFLRIMVLRVNPNQWLMSNFEPLETEFNAKF